MNRQLRTALQGVKRSYDAFVEEIMGGAYTEADQQALLNYLEGRPGITAAEVVQYYDDHIARRFDEMDTYFSRWQLALEPTDGGELRQIQVIACFFEERLEASEIGFVNACLELDNAPENDEPTWERTEEGYRLTLCAESGANWCQAAWQLGYLMMHCLIDQFTPDDRYRIDWLEELICEASSLNLLYELWANWQRVELSGLDGDYDEAILAYLEQALRDSGTARLASCASLEELERINALGASRTEDRLEEAINLYYRIHELDLCALAHCRQFAIPGSVLIDTGAWREAEPLSDAVEFIFHLQDRIPHTKLPTGVQAVFHMETGVPTRAQLNAICDYMLSLRELSGDSLVALLHDGDDRDFEGPVFVQVCRSLSDSGNFRLEARLNLADGFHILVEREADARSAEALLRYVCCPRELPAARWEYVTEAATEDESY